MLAFLAVSVLQGAGQALIMQDNFETPGSLTNNSLWVGASHAVVESGGVFAGSGNHYLRVQGAGFKALSADFSAALNGFCSTLAFDFYEPSGSGHGVIIGYGADAVDINVDGAFVRILVGGGGISLNATDGTKVTNTGVVSYPRNTRLTFSLVLNHSGANCVLGNGVILKPKTMGVWYYDWSAGHFVYVMTIDVSTSTRAPRCIGFRTWSTYVNANAYIDRVSLIEGPVLLGEIFPDETSMAPVIPPRPFVHPCILNTQQDLDRIKYRVNYEPSSAAVQGWNALRKSSYASLTYRHIPYTNVVVAGGTTTTSETQFRNDGQAAWAAALQWVVTGDTRYRDKALGIVNDWADTFQMLSPAAGTLEAQLQLEAAWYAPVWVAAADILRYYNRGAAGWPSNRVAKFDQMMNYLYGYASQAANRNNNWGASAALAMMSIGAWQEDRTRFDAAVQAWRNNFVNVNAAVGDNGYIHEVCRDTTHPQYTLQVWMQAAEIAWKHGMDLYSTTFAGATAPQFAINLEKFSGLFLGLDLPPCSDTFLATYNYAGKQSSSGAYDIAYNHYVHRIGLTNLPRYSDVVVNHWRPGGVDGHFNPWSTLTHGDLAAGAPTVSSLGIYDSNTGAVVSNITDGATLNLRTLAGLGIGLQAAGQVSSVLYSTNGAAMAAAATNPPYLASVWPVPGNYFLSAAPYQRRTFGTIPGDLFTRFVRVIDLPSGWSVHDIGKPGVPLWAREGEGTYTLCAAGTNVGGHADQNGLVSALITGDLQITAKIQFPPGSAAGVRAGLMVRESPRADARQVYLALGPSGSDRALFCFRTNSSTPAISVVMGVPAGSLWLRLARLGNSFRGYYSTDGQAWAACGTATVPMNAGVQAGVSVLSGDRGSAAQAGFEKMLVEPLGVSFAEWQHWVFDMRGKIQPADPDADLDEDGRSNLLEYYLGSDPVEADRTPALAAMVVGNNPVLIALRLRERRDALQVGRKVYFSSDLVSWAEMNLAAGSEVEDLGSLVVRQIVLPTAAGAGYYRVGYPQVP